MTKFRKHILALLLLALVVAPRLPKLDSFVTLDEPFWLSVGANYYYAIGQREFQNTVYEYHPAVTTMTIITAAFLVYFPDYRGYGQGYFDVDKEKFDPFLIAHGIDPMHLLYISRLFQLAIIILFALIIFYLLSNLIGDEKAFLTTALVSSAPYFLGHSRVLSHEAMVAFFVIASIFGMMAYLESEKKWIYLFISAASAALAQLTKSSAMAMFPTIALILAVSIFEKMREREFKSALLDHLKIFGIWFAMLALVYFALWPGMWVAPGKMLYNVYGNAFSYALEGSRLQVTQELQPQKFRLDEAWGTINYFKDNVIKRSTPISWAGILIAFVFLFIRGKDKFSGIFKKMAVYLFVTAVMFILLFSFAQGKNTPHYIMTSYVSMDAIGALGWCALLGWLGMKWKTADRSGVQAGVVVLIVVLQLASALIYYPYYYTYENPIWAKITGSTLLSDYGEGYEHAAAYLAQKPNAKSLTVFAFRGRGPFSYFFPGRTILINPLFMEEPGMVSMFERLKEADYLVISDAFGIRTERTALFAEQLKDVKPEHDIYINGIYPIHIYRVSDLPPSFYETLRK